jgi:hypothetical protein
MERPGTSLVTFHLSLTFPLIFAFSRRTKRRKKQESDDESSNDDDEDDDGEDSEDPIEEDTEIPSSPLAKTDDPDEEMHSDGPPTKETKLGRGAPRKAKVRQIIYVDKRSLSMIL